MMKITRKKIAKIINEELDKVLMKEGVPEGCTPNLACRCVDGSMNISVVQIQDFLSNKYGVDSMPISYKTGEADGKCGSETRGMIMKFQSETEGLECDACVGPETAKAMGLAAGSTAAKPKATVLRRPKALGSGKNVKIADPGFADKPKPLPEDRKLRRSIVHHAQRLVKRSQKILTDKDLVSGVLYGDPVMTEAAPKLSDLLSELFGENNAYLEDLLGKELKDIRNEPIFDRVRRLTDKHNKRDWLYGDGEDPNIGYQYNYKEKQTNAMLNTREGYGWKGKTNPIDQILHMHYDPNNREGKPAPTAPGGEGGVIAEPGSLVYYISADEVRPLALGDPDRLPTKTATYSVGRYNRNGEDVKFREGMQISDREFQSIMEKIPGLKKWLLRKFEDPEHIDTIRQSRSHHRTIQRRVRDLNRYLKKNPYKAKQTETTPED